MGNAFEHAKSQRVITKSYIYLYTCCFSAKYTSGIEGCLGCLLRGKGEQQCHSPMVKHAAAELIWEEARCQLTWIFQVLASKKLIWGMELGKSFWNAEMRPVMVLSFEQGWKSYFFPDRYYGCNCANVMMLHIYTCICVKMLHFPHFSKQLNISRKKIIIRNDIILDANGRYRGLILVPHWSVKSWGFKQLWSGFYAIYYLLWVFCLLLIMWSDQGVTIPKWGYCQVLTGSDWDTG